MLFSCLRLLPSFCAKRTLFGNMRKCYSTATDATVTPVMSVSDIEQRCRAFMRSPDLLPIVWVGVFGSFARNEQKADSDVDLLLGFRAEATGDEMYHTSPIAYETKDLMGRSVDVLFMRDGQDLSFVRSQALLLGKTIYGSDEWRLSNASRAGALLQDTYARLRAVLRLEKLLEEKITRLNPEDRRFDGIHFPIDEVIHDLEHLISVFTTNRQETGPMNAYFLCAIDSLQYIVDKYKLGGAEGTSVAEKQDLWRRVTGSLPDRAGAFEYIYLPILADTLKRAGLDGNLTL